MAQQPDARPIPRYRLIITATVEYDGPGEEVESKVLDAFDNWPDDQLKFRSVKLSTERKP
jgi:hypothetical protein